MQDDAQVIDQQKSRVLGMVNMGCDRELAAHTVGWSPSQLRRELKNDEQFALELAKQEGIAELHHMKLVHKATEDEKNWRASTWWLAHRAAQRHTRRTTRGATIADIQEFIEELVDLMFEKITLDADRDQVVLALLQLSSEYDHDNVAELIHGLELDIAKENDDAGEEAV